MKVKLAFGKKKWPLPAFWVEKKREKKGFWKRKKLLVTTKNKGEEFKRKRHPLENLKEDKTKMSSEFLVSEQVGHIRLSIIFVWSRK